MTAHVCLSCFQSIFSQLKLSPNLKKVLFATALGSVALALTAHQLKRRGRKRKQATQGKDGQKTVGIPDALLKSGRPSSLKRGVYVLELDIFNYEFCCVICSVSRPLLRCISVCRSVHWAADDESQYSEQRHHEWNLFPGP